ncbi:MAG: RHS repeat domain-containing protein, partial [Thermonemataceae bacterium]
QNYLRFVYDAAGIKLRQEVWQEGQLEKWTDYEGSFIYEQGKLAFFHTAEGRAVAQYLPQGEGTQPTFAYEYLIKDHLGNNRVSFREGETETYLATMDGADNEGGFHNIAETRSNGGFMNTSASKTDVSQPIGVWKTLQVSKGDTLQLSTLAKYENEATENKSTQVSPILTNSGNGSEGEGTQSPPAWVLGVAISPASNNAEEGLPLAMLKAVLYEADGQTVIEERNTEISESAYQAWETLSSEWVMPENGLLQVSVVNTSDVEVLFDNVMVEYAPTLIAQEQHYYPFGLQMAGMGKQGQPQHRFTYNGKEEINDLGLGWIDYGWRMYDPAGVTWWSLDPLAEKYYPITPYAYVANSPMIFSDPNGMEIIWGENVNKDEKKQIKSSIRQLKKSKEFRKVWRQVRKSENKYVIKTGAIKTEGVFEGNTRTVMSSKSKELPDGTVLKTPEMTMQSMFTSTDFAPEQKGGTITLNKAFTEFEYDGVEADRNGILAEEIVHAAQYDNSMEGVENFSNNLDPDGNVEFESKAIVGQIQKAVGVQNLHTEATDAIAIRFGVNAFSKGGVNMKDYARSLEAWKKQANSIYRDAATNGNVPPKLLMKLIK